MRRQRLFARIHPPDQLIEGESYQVDLSVPIFEILWGGEAASRARPQLIATHLSAKSEWMWGNNNPSIAKPGVEELASRMSSQTELQAALGQDKLSLDSESASNLADLIAHVCGYEAMYPAQVGEATAFLTLDFFEHRGKPAQPLAPWCIGCGHLASEQAVPLLAGPSGCGICKNCVDSTLAPALENCELENPDFLASCTSEESAGSLYAHIPCGFCNKRLRRMMLPYSALCYPCIDICRKAMSEA